MMLRYKLALLALLIAGCATLTIDLPPVTDQATSNRHTGKVVWRDLLTNTPEASRRFYGELFGWEFERPGIAIGFGTDDSYMLIRQNGMLIGGMLDTNSLGRDDNISQWITVISVADVEAAAKRISAGGGELLTRPTALASRGTMAVAADPEGAIFSLIQTRDGDPDDQEPALNQWLWEELLATDASRAGDFYVDVFGYEVETRGIDGSDSEYRLLTSAGQPRAGILANPFEGERPVWLNYLRVEDPAGIAARVESLGGRVILPAQPRDIGGTVALVAGPSGAGVALQTWPLE